MPVSLRYYFQAAGLPFSFFVSFVSHVLFSSRIYFLVFILSKDRTYANNVHLRKMYLHFSTVYFSIYLNMAKYEHFNKTDSLQNTRNVRRKCVRKSTQQKDHTRSRLSESEQGETVLKLNARILQLCRPKCVFCKHFFSLPVIIIELSGRIRTKQSKRDHVDSHQPCDIQSVI